MKYKLTILIKSLDDLVKNKEFDELKSYFNICQAYKVMYNDTNNIEESFNKFIEDLEPYNIGKYCVWILLDEKENLYYCVKIFEDVKISETNCIIKHIANLSEGISFTNKELKILARYTKLKNGKLPIDLLIESINFKDYNSLLSNWKLTEKEVEEFKAKLERLIS